MATEPAPEERQQEPSILQLLSRLLVLAKQSNRDPEKLLDQVIINVKSTLR